MDSQLQAFLGLGFSLCGKGLQNHPDRTAKTEYKSEGLLPGTERMERLDAAARGWNARWVAKAVLCFTFQMTICKQTVAVIYCIHAYQSALKAEPCQKELLGAATAQ